MLLAEVYFVTLFPGPAQLLTLAVRNASDKKLSEAWNEVTHFPRHTNKNYWCEQGFFVEYNECCTCTNSFITPITCGFVHKVAQELLSLVSYKAERTIENGMGRGERKIEQDERLVFSTPGVMGKWGPPIMGPGVPIFPGIWGPGSPLSWENGGPGSPFSRKYGDPLVKMGTPL